MVARVAPPNTICELLTKFDPLTVRGKAGEPAGTVEGDRLEIEGASTVRVTGTLTGLLAALGEEIEMDPW